MCARVCGCCPLANAFTVAERVSNHKPLTLNGASLHVEMLRPARPPPVITTGDICDDSLLFVDLPANVDTNLLRNYAKNAADVSVDQIMFSPRPGVALVQYSTSIGQSVTHSLCTVTSGRIIIFMRGP